MGIKLETPPQSVMPRGVEHTRWSPTAAAALCPPQSVVEHSGVEHSGVRNRFCWISVDYNSGGQTVRQNDYFNGEKCRYLIPPSRLGLPKFRTLSSTTAP